MSKDASVYLSLKRNRGRYGKVLGRLMLNEEVIFSITFKPSKKYPPGTYFIYNHKGEVLGGFRKLIKLVEFVKKYSEINSIELTWIVEPINEL